MDGFSDQFAIVLASTMFLFLLSVLISTLTAYWVAKAFRSAGEQFWAALLAVTLPWGFIANLLSIGHLLAPAGWLLAQALVLALVAWLRRAERLPSYPLDLPQIPRLSPAIVPAAIALSIVVGILAMGLVQAFAQPLRLGDEMGYHGPRVIYWIGNASIFPFETHNDRQNVFGYQGELAFLWPVLFTRSEVIGGLIFALAGPLSAAGVFLVARKCRASVLLALLLTILYLSAPLIFGHLSGLKPELWFTLYLLGAMWWTMEACESEVVSKRRWAFFLAGSFAALAIATKFNALAFAPLLLLGPWLTRGRSEPRKESIAVALGLAVGAILSGLVLLLAFNWVREGGPLGSKDFVAIHSPERSIRQLRTHVARFPLVLFDPPGVSAATLRTTLEMTERDYLRFVDADEDLPMEKPNTWPGAFRAYVGPQASRFALAGLLALFVLIAGSASLVVEAIRTFPAIRLSRHSIVFLCVASLTSAIVLLVRWMTHSGVPDRFLIPSVSCLIALSPAFFVFSRRTWVVAIVVAISLGFSAPGMIATTAGIYFQPLTMQQMEGPFAPIVGELPQSARVLLFNSQHVAEYGLFGPREGFPRRVFPWGKRPFAADAFQETLTRHGITHIVFEDADANYFGWAPPLDVKPFLQWLAAQPAFRAVDTGSPRLRLFASSEADKLPKQEGRPPALLSALPAMMPLVIVEPGLRQAGIGLDGGRFSSPWPIENLGQDEAAFLWLGSGQSEGFRFRVWAPSEQAISLAMKLSAGPSRTDGNRTVEVSRTEDNTSQKQTFVASGNLKFPVTLRAGWNTLIVSSLDQANVGAMPNGDSRHLIVGLHDILVTANATVPGAGGR